MGDLVSYTMETPLETIISALERHNAEHPTPCHCTTCYAVIRAKAIQQDEARATKALTKTYTVLEILEEDATAAKHHPAVHGEPEMYYQQGKADAYRIALLTMREEYRGEIPSE